MEQAKKQDTILALINSDNTEEILEGIKQIRKSGKPKHLGRIIELLASTADAKVASDIEFLLNDLKEEKAIEPILAALSSEMPHPKRRILLSALWQSSLDASANLDLLVSIAIQGDYLECLECLTIIENLESFPSEEAVINNTMELKNYLILNKDKPITDDNDKRPLLTVMFEVLKVYIREN